MAKAIQVADRRCYHFHRCGLDGLLGGEQESQPATDGPGQVLGHPGWQENGFVRQGQVERTTNETIIHGIYLPSRNDGISISRRGHGDQQHRICAWQVAQSHPDAGREDQRISEAEMGGVKDPVR